jgi:leucyl/phenylalanyl-tRNA---protein transferase
VNEQFPYLNENESILFPSPEKATSEGIVAIGGNLSPGVLLSAYRQGVFPWFSETDPILWWNPNPRFVLYPEKIVISKSMKKLLKKNAFNISFDNDFLSVIQNCKKAPRKNQDGTWISTDMVDAYYNLHKLGFAHSVEVKNDTGLVGGLYGISLGKIFYGESMFSRVANTSKLALIALCLWLCEKEFHIIDCQVPTSHLSSMGSEPIDRGEFCTIVGKAVNKDTCKGNWNDIFPEFPYSNGYNKLLQ